MAFPYENRHGAAAVAPAARERMKFARAAGRPARRSAPRRGISSSGWSARAGVDEEKRAERTWAGGRWDGGIAVGPWKSGAAGPQGGEKVRQRKESYLSARHCWGYSFQLSISTMTSGIDC
jgi:hypothetical protein